MDRTELLTFITSDNQQAELEIVGNIAVMRGVICADTPAKVLRLIHEHPTVRTIQMENVPGSIDDQANLRAAAYVRKFRFTTMLKSSDSVASGGTEFFLAGETRIYEPGAKFGIHSWGGPGYQGKDVPRDDPQHQLYLDHYEEMGIPGGVYWRTLEAAPANDIHWMTEQELDEYRFRSTAPPTSFDSSGNQLRRAADSPLVQPLAGLHDRLVSILSTNRQLQFSYRDCSQTVLWLFIVHSCCVGI